MMEKVSQPLQSFQNEIRQLIKQKNKENVSLKGVKENDLSPDDMRMYDLVRKLQGRGGSAEDFLKEHEFEKYRSSAAQSGTSRKDFAAYLADELTSLLLLEQHAKRTDQEKVA
jgi:hypothetical protein